MFADRINISDRVADQLPEFIREDDQQFVQFLFEYYKSQEKTGRSYNVLNNLLRYLDLDAYDPKLLTSSTTLIKDVDANIDTIEVEQIDGFIPQDGSVMIDNEVIYYSQTVRGPDAILTPGISLQEFNKKRQALESPWTEFDGVKTTFDLKFLGTPVSPVSSAHLAVTVYGELLIPEQDYTIVGSQISFVNPPRARTGNDQVELTQILYYIGFADSVIKTLVYPEVDTIIGEDSMAVQYDNLPYAPIAEIGLIINRNGVLQRPYDDYVLTDNNTKIKYFVNISGQDTFHIRSIEYVSPSVGIGAEAVTRVGTNGEIEAITIKNGGSGYKLNFAPKVSIFSSTGRGSGSAARSLVNGIKNVQLINGGQGYTSYNPPVVRITEPSDLINGSRAAASITVDDTTGQVSGIEITNSGSGYDFIPAITFVNPGGAECSNPTIDSEGRLVLGSISITQFGLGYSNPPTIYIDPAPEDGIDAEATCTVSPDGQVVAVTITNRGRGYQTAPRARIVQPVGAQVLDVTVANGSVTNINLLTGGKGYTDAPSVYIVDDRKGPLGEAIGGTGAQAAATIFNGEITDINITNFGEGYSAANPPKVYIAEPLAAQASCDVGFGEVTGCLIRSSGSGYEPSSLRGCARGVSDVVQFDNFGNQVYAKEEQLSQTNHTVGSVVHNLDSQIIRRVFDKFRDQYMPTINIDYSQVNPVQVIKTIKDFYISKGTKTAAQYLFKILFGEQVDVYYPRDELVTPSSASWVVDTILRAELISGDPADLPNAQLVQIEDPVDQNIKDASVLIENVISIIEGTDTIYELAISEETLSGSFKIPYKTTLVEPLTTDGNIITVDSTIGWPEKNGTIIIDDSEVVQYKEKSLNQFIECTRSKNGVVEDWDPGTTIHSDIFVWVNKGLANEVKLRVLGIAEAGTTVLEDTGSYYLPGDKLNVAALGGTDTDERLQSWLYNVKKLIKVTTITPGGSNNQTATVVCENPHGLLVEDKVTIYGANPAVYNGTYEVTSRLDDFTFTYAIPVPTQIVPQGNILLSVDLNRGKSTVTSINEVVSLFTSNIQNSFFNNDFVYVAASGLPNYKIGPFQGSALIPGNQRKLLRFPRTVSTVSTRTTIQPNNPVGSWVNGVAAWSYKSKDFVTFGPLTAINITNNGQDYDAGSKPALQITGGGGTGASASVTVNGSLFSIEVTNEGSGYTEQPLISIVGGGGSGATAQAVVTNGRVTRILVENAGVGYTSQPTISITGGGGTGALANAQVRGPISGVALTSAGSGYTSTPEIKLNSGEGALAQPIVINGRIVSIAIINSGQNYTTAPTVFINGDGFGAQATAVIGTLGEDKGKVISVQITNKGVGYTQGMTTVRMEAVGQLATFEATVFKWNKNLEYDLNSKYDIARGYVFTGFNNQYGGEYAHVSDPKELRYVVGDNVVLDPQTQNFREIGQNEAHSPIIGWAFDGNPIYGPYGYIDPTDQNSGLRRMRSSYKLKDEVVYDIDTNPTPSRTDGPALSSFPAGTFINDYEYDFQRGDLDPYNGRFCKTPDYPAGTYAYFVTIDESDAGLPVFPYIIGPEFNSVVDTWNLGQTATQENIPADVSRFRDPYANVDIDIDRQPNQRSDELVTEREGDVIIFEIEDLDGDGIISPLEIATLQAMTEEAALQIYDYFPFVSTESRVDIEVENTTKFESAQIDGFVIENPGVSYQVNDTLFFDNTGTDGFGASAQIESVTGQEIAQYQKEIINDEPYGRITTAGDHELIAQDEIIISSKVITDNTNKRFYMSVVTGIESISVDQIGVGYNEAIPPTYEIITDSGQDVELDIILDTTTGKIDTVNIINSGFNYSTTDVPQIRVSHPQQYKKTYYWVNQYVESGANASTFEIFDIQTATDRTTYVCGEITQTNGNTSAFLAKFSDLGGIIWDRSLLPSASIKKARFKRIYLDETSEDNHLIYVLGETESQSTAGYNPDILLVKYESGLDNANNPEGIIRFQKEIAGVSGATRRDYAGDIYLDDEQRLYICGWTDTNSPDPDDIWVIQVNNQGDVVEKRKFASDSEGEQMHQLLYIGDNKIAFAGIDLDNNDLMFGEMVYDGANIEMSYVKKLAVSGGQVQRPQFVLDQYDDLFFTCDMWNGTKNYGVAFFKIARSEVRLTAAAPTWYFSKIIAPSVSFESINHAGITLDEFGNVNVLTHIKYEDNNQQVVASNFKYDGTLLYKSNIIRGEWDTVDSETDYGLGFTVSTHSIDNSGDLIIPTNKQVSIPTAVYRFNDSNDTFFDATKQKISAVGVTNSGQVIRDDTVFKFGTASLKMQAAARLDWTDFNNDDDWTVGMWVKMTGSHSPNNPKMEMVVCIADNGDKVKYIVDGDATSPNFGKIILDILPNGGGGTTVVSVGSTYMATLAAEAWHHVVLVKEEPTLGSYVYSAYFDGVQVCTATRTEDIAMDDLAIGSNETSAALSTAFLGNIDDIVVEPRAVYTGSSLVVPTERYRIETKNSGLDMIKFDRLHSKRSDYQLSATQGVVFSEATNLNVNNLNNPVITVWNEGSSGLQILDYSDVTSTLNFGTYTFTETIDTFTSKTSTVPSPLGKRLLISPNVVAKYYVRDAGYSKIDNVKKFTFNQDVKFDKGTVIQQFNAQGVTQAFGTIVETPVGPINNPGYGTEYKIGKIFGTFNNTDRLRNSTAQENLIEQIDFTVKRPQEEWVSGKAYNVNDQVYSNGKIYAATNTATSGSTAPTHEIGIVTDGAVTWNYISASGTIQVNLNDYPWPTPLVGLWETNRSYSTNDFVYFGRYKYQATSSGISGNTAPVHTSGTVTDGNVTWSYISTYDPLSDYARFRPYREEDYRVTIVDTYSDSDFIIGDVVSLGNTITAGPNSENAKIADINGVGTVKSIKLTVTLDKDITRVSEGRSDLIYATAVTPHNYTAGDILFVEGFDTGEFNGSFFVQEVFSSRDFTYRLRATATQDPAFSTTVSGVKIASKHPTLMLTRNHSYIFDLSDASNFGYYLSFSQDNQYKLEYSFNVIEREGTPGLSSATETPVVKFTIGGEVTNITYYFDPSRLGDDSPVGINSFIDVIKTPFDGKFTISEILSDTEFRFPLLYEPEFTQAEIGKDEFDRPNSSYSTTSLKAIGPINTIKLISPGGFYKKLPVVSDIASDRKIEKVRIENGGTEYASGVYTQVPILGDGEGGLVQITVEIDDEIGSGTITDVTLTDPGKGYTTASIDVDGIEGILGPTLSGSGAELNVIIPAEGSGAAVFLTGRQIGKIKTLKNNEFGYGYSHDYTLRPEIAFPINLQLFNTSILSQIKITNPGAGYTSAPSVIIQGGGGTGAEAEAVVKNNRLSEILIKNPGAGYSSQPSVTLKSEFTYVVNLDLNYLQFNFPHGITTGAEIQFRADDIGTEIGVLPKPSSVGLTSLSSTQTYYAIAGNPNGLEADQLRFALTKVDAESGNFITFLTQGDGRQVLLTEVFGGAAEAVVETSRFLEGEELFQGESYELASAFGVVSENEGWQIQPKILKVTNPRGNFVVGGKVQGVISRASGLIDNINIAKGVLNIDALTKTPGRFVDDVGKPSEIVQKIQDSFFYQNFSYVVKSKIPINKWKSQILENNHPVGFNMFGQLELTGGKDISGRKVVAGFTKQVNINEYTNVNQITSFGAAQPIYSTFNNSEVLFRKKRLTNSEEILTSIVKKIDDISGQFDGATKQFPLQVEGENVIVKDNQLVVTLNGVIQAPGESFQVVGNNIVFAEPPKPDSKVVYRNVEIEIMPITRFNLNTIGGIFPSLGDTVNGFTSEARGKVVATGTTSIDVVDITGGPFQLNERIDVGRTGFSALIGSIDDSVTKLYLENVGGTFTQEALAGVRVTGANSGATATIVTANPSDYTIDVTDMANGYFDRGEAVTFFGLQYGGDILNVDSVNYKTIFEFGETVTALDGDQAIIEETNQDLDGNIDDKLVLSKTSGTSEYETGIYDLRLQDIFYSASSNIAARIVRTSPYRDPIVNINLVRPANVSGEWESFEEGDKFQGPGGVAKGEVVKIDYEASPPILYYLKGTEADLQDGDSIQRYFNDPQGNILLDALTETVQGDVRLGDVVDQLIINKGSTFFGLVFERLISLNNQNVILDDISKTTITPTQIADAAQRINADFLDFEEVRSTEIEYENLTGGTLAANDVLRSITFEYGNTVTDSKNRFKDAGRMISLNKDEIVDYANAEIAVEHPGFYYPGDNETDAWSRYADAYRLIQKNKAYIQAKAYALMVAEYPSLTVPSADKCKRDIGYYVDALSFDLYSGGTVYTRKLAKKYFSTDETTFLYVNNEADATEFGFDKATELMRQALRNDLNGSEVVDGVTYIFYNERTTGGSTGTGITADPSPGNAYGTAGSNTQNYGVNNCADVQSALQTLCDNISVILLSGSLADLLDEVVPTQYTINEVKCRRDIGLMVDALAADVTDDGNFNIVEFAKKYFQNGAPISNGLVGELAESLTAFRKAGEMARRAINNLLYVQVNTRTPELGYMLKDPSTYQGPYLGAAGTTLQQFTPTSASYTPATGVMTIGIGTHSLTTSDSITIRPYSMNFTCTMDGGATFHEYPRAGDPAFNTPLQITGVSGTTIDVNVGASPLVQFTPTGANYNPATGAMELTIGSHTLEIGDDIRIATDSLTFTCTQDNNGSNHTYPRASDPAAGATLAINAVTATTITVNVGASPIGQQYPHTFVSANANAVSTGGGYTHTFIDAVDNAIFVGGGTEAAYYDPNYSSGSNESIQNCADVQAVIHTLVEIAATAIGAGNLDSINALPLITDGTFNENENLRVFKFAYKDRAGNGFFIPGDTIRGLTSNANFIAQGTNSGLKWLFTNSVTGSFQDREYITNSKLTPNGAIALTKLQKKAGTQSLNFGTHTGLSHDLSSVTKLGGSDFTIEMWLRPTTNPQSGTKFLYDTRTQSATLVNSPVIYLENNSIKYWLNGSDQISGAHNMVADQWHHVAVTRTTGITKIFVNGTQTGGDYSDTNVYVERPFRLMAAWDGTNTYQGYVDNFMIHNESLYSGTFTPGTTYPTNTANLLFGMDNESPIIVSTEEAFGIYTGQTNSAATAKKINYETKEVIVEDIDLSRDEHRKCADMLELNLDWISETAVGKMAEKYPDFVIPGDTETSDQGTNKCIRDTKEYILKAIIADIRYGGNYNSVISGRGYLTKSGGLNYVGNELLQSIYAWNELADVMNYVITTTSTDLVHYGTKVDENGDTVPAKYTDILRIPNNFASPASSSVQNEISSLSDTIINILCPTGDRFRDAGDAIWKNRDYISEEVVGYIQAKYSADIQGPVGVINSYDFLVMPGYGEPYCLRDIKKFILPAVITDLLTGGNSSTQYVLDQYINDTNQILHVETELSAMLDAFEYTKKLCHHAINNTLLTQGTTASGLGIDGIYQDDYYVALYTEIEVYRDTTVTIDSQGADQTRSNPDNNKLTDAADMIERNKYVIAWEAVHTMNDMSKHIEFTVPGGRQNCVDDIVDIIEGLVHDLRLGGNSKTWDAAQLYLNSEDDTLLHIEGEESASQWAMKFAKEISILTIRNGFGRDNIYIYKEDDGGTGGTPGGDLSGESFDEVETRTYEQNAVRDRYIDAANIIERNIRFIAEEAVYLGQQQFPSLVINGGTVGGVKFSPTGATYNSATGVMELTIGSHSLVAGNQIYIQPHSLVFTCTKDGNATEHAYPRTTDPYYNDSIAITGVTGTTITVNVGASPAGEQYAHTFVRADANSVTTAGSLDCVHDVTDILDAVQWNLRYGGNNRVFHAAELYVTAAAVAHVSSQVNETTWIFNKAIDLAVDVMQNDTITKQGSHPYTQKFYNDLDFFPYNDPQYSITADGAPDSTHGVCADVRSSLLTLMDVVTDTLATPASITNGTIQKSLPNIWPVKYSNDMVDRDTSVTYDDSATGGWNTTCEQEASAIETLYDLVIDTISVAASATPTPNHLTTVTRTTPYNSNTNYQFFTCYNVTSAANTLFDLMIETLGGGSFSERKVARYLTFNKHAIVAKSFSEVTTQYPGTLAPESFAQVVMDAIVYDLNTGGNSGAMKLANSWFDGEGNFIAYPDVTRQHLVFYLARISEATKRICYDQNNTAEWGTDNTYFRYLDDTLMDAIEYRFEYEQESTEFRIDSCTNPINFALTRSTPPTNNSLIWVNSTHAQNLQNNYDEGTDWNTDPELVLNTPTVEVGFERRENRVKITRPNFYSRGDVLTYVPASSDVEQGLQGQSWFYVLNATPQFFEIAREIRHDARYSDFDLDLSTGGQQRFNVDVRSGIEREATTFGDRDIDTPISGGFNLADVVVGSSSNCRGDVIKTRNNEAEIIKLYKRANLISASGRFTNGERVNVDGDPSNYGFIVQTSILTGDNNNEGNCYIENITGSISDADVLVGVDSSVTATVSGALTDRMLVNIGRGAFAVDEMIFNKGNGAEADIVKYENSAGALTGNTNGRITIDIESLQDDFVDGDIIYGSVTDYILDIADVTTTGFKNIELNQYLHGQKTIKLEIISVTRDQGFLGDFNKGDLVYLLQGTIPAVPGWTAVVTEYTYDPDNSIHEVYIANIQPFGQAADGSVNIDPQAVANGSIGKFENLSNFPIFRADISAVTVTDYTSYGKVAGKAISGTTGRIWLEDAVGAWPSNMTVISDYGWSAGVTQSKELIGRCDRFFRGFDGTATSFKLTVNNGEAYFPDPAGHLLVFVNGVLQPPGAVNAYTAFSDQIQFTEPPTIGSEFIGYYVGKLRQLDDISFEFDSLRSSFNLKYQGGFYSLTLTEGVSSNTILPENNIIVSLNGVIQEPGIGYNLVGSRIIFAETPRAGSTFVGFSYIGSDADVIAATVVPPIEAGDILQIEGEGDPREVALIESSNSLITFEYTGTVKGRNAAALATIRSGEITQAQITAPGDGYTSRPNVDVVSSTGFDGRIRALMGISSIVVKNPGIGYEAPVVTVETTVPDDFVAPEGGNVNGGFDTYAGEGTDADGNPIVIVPGYILVNAQPTNVTVNQGQTASFTVDASFIVSADGSIGTTALNYQWQRKQYGETNWVNITGQTSAIYSSNASVQADDGDEFRVAITAAGATPIYSNSVILTVQTGATIISGFSPAQIFQ